MRICSFIPIYGIGTLILVFVPTAYAYLHPWLDVAQSFALASFVILLCRLLSSEADLNRDVFLAPMRVLQSKSGDSTVVAAGKYRRTWILVFQYPIVAVLVAIFTDITQGAGVYCYGSHKTYFASLWLEIATKVSMGAAIAVVIRLYGSLKKELAPHRALQKLLAFKMLIGLQFLQQVRSPDNIARVHRHVHGTDKDLQIVYMILQRVNPSPLQPTAKLSYTDVQIGIPLLIVMLELVIFSVFFHFAYSITPYVLSSYAPKVTNNTDEDQGFVSGEDATRSYQGGPLGIRAWAAIFNPMEIVAAWRFAFNLRTDALQSGRASASYYNGASPLQSQPPQYQGYGSR